MNEGKLVPSELVCGAIEKQMENLENKTLIIEGYPKN